VAEWLGRRPARLVGLDRRKGSIAPGMDADLVVFDPDTESLAEPAQLHHRHKATPYEGRRLRGRVERTYLRGQLVYEAGRFFGPPRGRPVLRP
jgi:allantoinase